jgi:uncharacterized protein YndB with AHSA1/START domain
MFYVLCSMFSTKIAMPTVDHDILLQAPPDRIWAFITALRYLPLWLVAVEAVQSISTAQTQAGTTC